MDRVLIADHQFPGDYGPVRPRTCGTRSGAGSARAGEVIDGLHRGDRGALDRVARPQLAHLFSLLPKMGLDEADVPGTALDHLARTAAGPARGWRSTRSGPARPPRTIRALAAAGVPLVASTDSHDCATIGQLPAGPRPSWTPRCAGAVPG